MATTSKPAPYQHHAHKNSSNYNPMTSGANTPMNVSPTSPRTTSHVPPHLNHPPQIRPQKNPIYVPAALRRTEKPARQSPPKVDSVVDSPNSSWGSGTGFGQPSGEATPTVPRIATEDLNSILGDAPLSPITGPITRNHWQPDNSTSVCTASACQTPFGLFNRRHHCRKCGGIFCWQHSARQLRLDELARFHPEGDLQRACDRCYTQFREWEQLRTSRHNSESSGSTAAVQIGTPTAAKRSETHRIGSIASSVSNAWNWSTF